MMKKIKKILFFSCLLILLTSSSCENNNGIETGDNTFSCYVNGNLFIPKANTSFSTLPVAEALRFYMDDSRFRINVGHYKKYEMMLNILEPHEGIFNLSESSSEFTDYSINHAILRTDGKTYISKQNSGTITLSIVSNINIEGTFNFTLYNKNDDSDIIYITDGKFNN